MMGDIEVLGIGQGLHHYESISVAARQLLHV